MALVVTGTVVTFDPAQEIVRRGAVYLSDDGTVEVVRPSARPAPAGYGSAPRVARAASSPLAHHLHNHLAYNTLPLWRAPKGRALHHQVPVAERCHLRTGDLRAGPGLRRGSPAAPCASPSQGRGGRRHH